MSSDFGTAGVTLETRMGTAVQDVQTYAKAVGGIGDASAKAADHVDRLEKTSQNLADAQKAVTDGAKAIAEMQRRGLTGTEEYLKAMDRQRVAYLQMMDVRKRATEAVVAADKAAAQSAKPAAGGPGVRDIATGVGVGVAAEHFAEAAAGKVKDFVVQSVSAAAQLHETMSTNAEIFGAASKEVEQFGDSAARSLGLSKQAAVEAVDAFGGLFHGVGLGDAQALPLSKQLTQIGVDLAAMKHEADPGAAFNALRQAVTGQYEGLRQYDVVLTAAAVKQEALKLGLIRTTADALTPQTQALSVAALVGDRAASSTGAFARSTDELTGKTKVLNAQLDNSKGKLGEGLLPALQGAADAAGTVLVPALDKLATGLRWIGEHDVSRHLVEIGAAMYGLTVAVNITAAAYARLFTAATAAAGAEVAAAGGAAGRGGLLFAGGVRGLAVKTGIGAAVAAGGVLIAEGTQTSERERLRQGAIARGTNHAFDRFGQAYSEQVAHTFGRGLGFVGLGGAGRALDRATGYSYDLEAADRAAAAEQARMAADAERERRAREHSSNAYVQAQVRAERARARKGTADFNVRDARAYLDSKQYVADAGSIPLGGLLDALPEKPDASIVTNARDEKKAADAALAIAEARRKQARAGGAGASRGQIAAAEASVISARDATRRRGGNPEAEALRLEAAEARLAKLRQGGKTDTIALQTAEKGLEDARARQRRATENLHKAEKDASGDKSLSLKDVMARAAHTAGVSTAEVKNVRSLVKAGLSEPVIAELEQLEQTAPGTIARVAKGITPAFVNQLNRDQKARDDAAINLAKLGGQAKLKTAQAEAAKSGKVLGDSLAAPMPVKLPALDELDGLPVLLGPLVVA